MKSPLTPSALRSVPLFSWVINMREILSAEVVVGGWSLRMAMPLFSLDEKMKPCASDGNTKSITDHNELLALYFHCHTNCLIVS